MQKGKGKSENEKFFCQTKRQLYSATFQKQR